MNWRYLPWVFPRQATRPTGSGPPLRGSLPILRAFYPEGEGAAGGAPSRHGKLRACCVSPCRPAREAFHGEDHRPAASVRAAPPERHSTGRIAGPHRTPTSPRYSHATRTPARPVGLPRPPGSGQKGVGAGVTTPPYQRPRAVGASTPLSPSVGAPGFGGLPPPGIQPRLGGLHGRWLRTLSCEAAWYY